MKARWLFFIALLLAMFCAQSLCLTLDEIIEKNIEARGGMEKIKSVKTMKMTGKYLMQGMELPFITYHKRPAKFRLESTFQGMTMVQAFDGEIAWTIMPWTGSPDPVELPDIQAKMIEQQADFDGFLIDYKDKEFTVELIGKEDMEGTEVYNLKVTTKEKLTVNIYLDAEYFLELKTTLKGEIEETQLNIDMYYGNYKEVDGLMMPHSIEWKMAGDIGTHVVMDKTEFGVEIDDSIFVMPRKEVKEVKEEKEVAPKEEPEKDSGKK